MEILGYELGECLYNGKRTVVYRGKRISDNRAVVIKCLKSDYPSFNELVQFRNQYAVAKNLEIPGIIRPDCLLGYRNGYALVMEDFGGIALHDYALNKTPKLPLAEVLEIAIQLSDILHALHNCRVIHKDIKPANILIHPQTRQIKLIDFSIASLLPKEIPEIQNPNILEGTLAYIAPEQTGRMNRAIDYRADFYSFGAMLYELLTWELPFPYHDPSELIHAHIAKMPVAPHKLDTTLPPVLSSLVLKLMAKNAEDRYQSALGLKYDLEQCARQWQETGTIAAFELGQRDLGDRARFLIPEKLYGREAEVAQLLAAFDRVSGGRGDGTSTYLNSARHKSLSDQEVGRQGEQPSISNSEIVLVAGFSGIGKTAIVNEVHKPITAKKGYFIKGKFDQFNRNLPFSAFLQALRDLMGQLMAESDARLQAWKHQILEAVGENGRVLIEVLPELESILGSQPPVPELSGAAARDRFNLLFQKFIAVFARPEHPLVLFLDDLQWADSASLRLIKLLMEERSDLLLLGAYRDNEVSPAHPFILTVEELKKSGKRASVLELGPLGLAETKQLLADSLHCSLERALPLAEILHERTTGNPFFLTQLLKVLYEGGQIAFNRELGYWECDLAGIRARCFQQSLGNASADDVVEFVAAQLQALPEETQQVLKLAACIGNPFDLDTLAIVSQQEAVDVAAALWKALQEGLILPQSEVYKFYLSAEELPDSALRIENVRYRFLHDRVQQAAYSLIPDEEKQNAHYRIGRLLLERIAPEAREERIFELVNQFNYGAAIAIEQTERDELARLNLLACQRAKVSTAYQAGRDYANTGIALLGEAGWQRQYETSLALHELAAEFAALCGESAAMERFVETAIDCSHSVLDRVNVYRIKIQFNVAQHKLIEAITVARQLLAQLGVTFPDVPTQNDIEQAIAELQQLLGDRAIESLIDLPEMTDDEKIATLQIINTIMPAAYMAGSPLFPLLVVLPVKLSVQHGNTENSILAYASYGILTCNVLKDVESGVRFGQLALQLSSKLDAKTIKGELLIIIGLFLLHRQAHIKKTLILLQEGYTTSLEVGNQESAGYGARNFCINAFWGNQSLATLKKKTVAYTQELIQLNQRTTANQCRISWQSILRLKLPKEYPSILSGYGIKESDFLAQLIEAHDFYGLYIFYLYKLMLGVIFDEVDPVRDYAMEVKRYSIAAMGTVCEPAFLFYDSLSLLNQVKAHPDRVKEVIQNVEENQFQLQQYWAERAPMNHQHKVDLVEAEKCRLLGQPIEAIERYDRAIAGAQINDYLQEEALANELAAKFYLDWGKEKVAATYMQDAYYNYAKWGAKAKINDLEKRYPQLLAPILQQSASFSNPVALLERLDRPNFSSLTATSTHPSSASFNTALDFAAVLKAARSISSSLALEELVAQLTEIVLQNSGAERCALILPNREGEWYVEALATPERSEVNPRLLEEHPDLPVKLIQYVKNARNILVIDDLNAELPVMDDYLKQQQPKSILGLPILERGNLVGILYLENRLASGVFTHERLVLLNFLSTQAAISLENARLYQQAQDYAQQLEQSQLKIVQSEKMASVGNLVAGVAHEINNPIGFLNGSITNAKDFVRALLEHLETYRKYVPVTPTPVEEHAEDIALDFISQDLPQVLESMQSAIERIKMMSISLRNFSRTDSERPISADLHQGLDSTLLILKYRLKADERRPAIEVIKDYGDLPEINCFPGQLNQVFMNLLANAIDALEEASLGRSFAEIAAHPNRITIRTLVEAGKVKIAIADNGVGMPPEVQARIFDHLFTTKGVGKGTGLGLAIAREIVVGKHGGTLDLHSQPGRGSTFTISIPQ